MLAKSTPAISSDFIAWLQANGVVAYDIKAAYVAEGWRGIAAVNQLPAGGLCISFFHEQRNFRNDL